MRKKPTLKYFIGTGLALGLAGCSAAASPEDYPESNVQVIIPYDAGGNMDTMARPLVQCMETELGGRFVVENHPGSAGVLGTQAVAGADPDGYTLGFSSVSPLVLGPRMMENIEYSMDDFEFIGHASAPPMAIIVDKDSEFTTMDELVEAASNQPVVAATPGADSLQSLFVERLNQQYGTQVDVVPTDSATEILRGVSEGDYQVGVTTTSADLVERLEDGEVRLLMHGASEDYQHLPQGPSIQATRYGEVLPETTLTGPMMVPAGTPQVVVERLTDSASTCLADEELRETIGVEMLSENFIDGEQVKESYRELEEALDDQ